MQTHQASQLAGAPPLLGTPEPPLSEQIARAWRKADSVTRRFAGFPPRGTHDAVVAAWGRTIARCSAPERARATMSMDIAFRPPAGTATVWLDDVGSTLCRLDELLVQLDVMRNAFTAEQYDYLQRLYTTFRGHLRCT